MGIFGKKQSCAICDGKIGIMYNKYPDGTICSKCIDSINGISDTHINTVSEFKEFKLYLDERASIDFPVQDKKRPFEADRSLQLLHFPSKYGRVFKFSELDSVELVEDGEVVSKSGLGRAVAGGLLFGGAGAIVGGITGKKDKSMVNNISLRINFNNPWIKIEELKLLEVQTKKDSLLYKTTITYVKKLKDELESYVTKDVPVSSGASEADELLKFKSLLDAGVITQEEFDKKKQQILGI